MVDIAVVRQGTKRHGPVMSTGSGVTVPSGTRTMGSVPVCHNGLCAVTGVTGHCVGRRSDICRETGCREYLRPGFHNDVLFHAGGSSPGFSAVPA